MKSSRPIAVGVTALLALSAAGSAAAQTKDVTVTAAAESGSRQFFVEDLTGTALTALDLGASGQGQPFQVRVADNGFLSPQAPFTASAEMTHLYKDGEAFGTKVASDKVAVSYVGAPDVTGVSVGAIPTIRLTGSLPTCSNLGTLLPSTSPLRGGSLLGLITSPLNVLLGSMGLNEAAKPLCTALGGTSTTPLPVAEADAVLVQLQEQLLQPASSLLAGLPVAVGGTTETGAFTNPSYLGAGSGDAAKASATAATKRKMLAGSQNSTFDLAGLVSPTIDGKPLFGTGGLTSVSSVVAGLQSSVTAGVATVGTSLAGLSSADQSGVLGGMTSSVATLASSTLKRISGTYRSFPSLKADLAGAPVGTYTGTMTVTFVQE